MLLFVCKKSCGESSNRVNWVVLLISSSMEEGDGADDGCKDEAAASGGRGLASQRPGASQSRSCTKLDRNRTRNEAALVGSLPGSSWDGMSGRGRERGGSLSYR